LRVHFTGRGISGSWQIRGEQLSAAMGATAKPNVSPADADWIVGVKRISDELARAARGRLVWDVVDAWPQPAGNGWNETQCKQWLADEMQRLQPRAVIAATKVMAQDLAGFGVPVLWLPHHYRPRIAINPIRDRIYAVGYEGAESYIRPWRYAIERECSRIGARFVINSSALADVDVVLAMRHSLGYAPRNWKSGVKLANAHGSGTPFIGARERGYIEAATGGECWADRPDELGEAFEQLAPESVRWAAREAFLKAAYSVDEAGAQLRDFLHAL
jgi:hypothetical protein